MAFEMFRYVLWRLSGDRTCARSGVCCRQREADSLSSSRRNTRRHVGWHSGLLDGHTYHVRNCSWSWFDARETC